MSSGENVLTGTYSLTRPDGHVVNGKVWRPAGAVRAVVLIAHGLAEHIDRYDRFASALTDAGYMVAGHNHRGHGEDARAAGTLGHFADENGWALMVEDLRAAMANLRELAPDVPAVLFGHSMGSFMVQDALGKWPEEFGPAILSGTSGPPPAIAALGRLICRVEKMRVGGAGQSGLLHKMAFGDFNKSFKPARTDLDWLSRDEDEVDKYVNSDLCGFVCSVQSWSDLLSALPNLTSDIHIARLDGGKPVYMFSGGRDPVGGNGKGVRALEKIYRRQGVKDIAVTIYEDGRHEMLNEINRDQVVDELLQWLDGVLANR